MRAGAWKYSEDVHLKEARALIAALERNARAHVGHRQRKPSLPDNMGDVLAFDRCRAKKYPLLRLVRRWRSLCLCREMRPTMRWIPRELNLADELPRSPEAP